jgi:hypothetical protein
MRRIATSGLLLALAIILVSCSGSKTQPTAVMPSVGGSWEFIATSTTSPGYSTGIEVALQQGTVFVNDGYNPSGQISASGPQLGFVGLNLLNGSKHESIVFGGNCTAATPDAGNNLAGTISGVGGAINFTYIEGGNVFNVTAMLNANGQSIVGTYTEQAASAGQSNGICNADGTVLDTGNIAGAIVPKFSGTYTGEVCQPNDATCTNSPDAATAILSQSGTVLTMNLLLTGADNTSLALSGPVAGNSFTVQGTFSGLAISYEGYVQYVFDSIDGLYDTPTVYLVNTACDTSLYSCGNLLTVPVVP